MTFELDRRRYSAFRDTARGDPASATDRAQNRTG